MKLMNQALEETLKAVEKKEHLSPDLLESKIKVNESLGRAAFFYEKLRNAIDYQDEHLFLKNAIKRILKRRAYTGLEQSGGKLLHELVWARYFRNDTLPAEYVKEIDKILNKYSEFKTNIVSRNNSRFVTNAVLSFASYEIEQFLSPDHGEEKFSEFATGLITRNIDVPSIEIEPAALRMQITIAVEKLLFKSDQDQIKFRLLRFFYPKWPDISKEEMLEFGRRFDEIMSSIDWQISQNRNSKIFKYVRRVVPPFVILWDMIRNNPQEARRAFANKYLLLEKAQATIGSKNRNIYKRVLRAIFRGIIFILATKVILAFLVELPYEMTVLGKINYVALITNTSLPPILMLVAGMFISIPGRKNTQVLLKMIEEAVFEDELYAKRLETIRSIRERSYLLFNLVYTTLSLAILSLVVWGLIALKFNVVSIVLFFIFVSIVSFLTFRIRATAKELEVKTGEDSLSSGIFNFLLLPFVIIGKFLSDKWSDYNFTLLFWDFIVEAPFKAIIGVFEAWIAFVREKREDFE